MPSSSYCFSGAKFLHFQRNNSLVSACPFLANLLLGLVPAGKELLRRLLVAPLQVAHARNVFGVLVSVPKRTRFPFVFKKAQVVGALVIARVARIVDRIAGVGVAGVLVFLDCEVLAQIVYINIAVEPLAISSNRDSRSPKCLSGSVTGSAARACCLRYSATSSRVRTSP
jgi:hypothetical protein